MHRLFPCLTLFCLVTAPALAQTDFEIPGTPLPLEELTDTREDRSTPEELADFGTAGPDPAPVAPEQTAPTAAPFDIPGITFVRIALTEDGLAGASFEVPESWVRDDDQWSLMKDGKPVFMFNINAERGAPGDGEREKMLKELPPDVAKTARFVDLTLAGKTALEITMNGAYRGQHIATFGLIFAEPVREDGNHLAISLAAFEDHDLAEQLYGRIRQSIRFDAPPDAPEGTVPLVLEQIEPGNADGAIAEISGNFGYSGTEYLAASVDLNGDGTNEWIVKTRHSYLCYGNLEKCRLWVMHRNWSGDWRALVYPYAKSVALLPTETNGFRDLLIDGALYGFSSSSYRKGGAEDRGAAAEPTPAPAAPTHLADPNPQAVPDKGEDWQTYANARFGTQIEYPAHLLNALQPPENGDGQSFATNDGSVSLLVYASHNALEWSLRQMFTDEVMQDSYQSILEKSLEENRFFIKARSGDAIVAQGMMLDAANVIHAFQLSYPQDAEDTYGPIAARMRASFDADPAQPNPPASDQADTDALELAFWQTIASSNDPADFAAYLDRWPDGTFAVLAQNALNRAAARTPAAPVQQATVGTLYTPARGSAERTAIMNAARAPIGSALAQNVIFVVSELNSDGTWAYLQAVPLQPNGQPLNWATTPFARDWANDVMSDIVMLLLYRQDGNWRVVDHVIGPTDVHWYGWIDKYGLPERLFHG